MMDRAVVLKLAREAGAIREITSFADEVSFAILSRFADLVEAEVRVEVEWLRKDYHHACATVAQLYAAATGRHGEGPLRGVIEDVAAVRAERDALQAEVQRLKADAERYRWLRDVATGDEWDYIMTTEDTDAAIDAARG